MHSLRLASKVDAIKDSLANDEEKVAADIVKRALSYPLKLIAKNAGVTGSVVSEKVSSFETFAQHAKAKEIFFVSEMPRGCDKLDFLRWRISMHRDFTINRL